MIKVYFESKIHAELAAIFDSEETYYACSSELEGLARKHRMFITTSVEKENLNQIEIETNNSAPELLKTLQEIYDIAKKCHGTINSMLVMQECGEAIEKATK